MEISRNCLGFFTSEQKRHNAGIFDLVLFQRKVVKYYCEPLNKIGICPRNCLSCRASFIHIVKNIIQDRTRDPYGTVTQLLQSEMNVRTKISNQKIGLSVLDEHLRFDADVREAFENNRKI